MLFASMTFLWVFLPILFATYFLVKEKYRNYILLIFSLIFYSWGEPKYVILMIVSIIMNYILGRVMDKQTKTKRKIILAITIVLNLLLLGYFKYFNFFVNNLNSIFNHTVIHARNIALPIGISFYTFQIMSYIIDLYRKEIKVQKNIFKLALYISFFPQLIAGPIVKYHDIEEQINKRRITIDGFSEGVKRFIIGLSKKVLIANTLALVADSTFDSNIQLLSTPIAWLGAFCYMFQIFYDFSGYSDMAIGLGKMFGFTFMENFNLPYTSQSITEFWRRWHISLSTWFKEYLYIPLGGNRKGKTRTYINLLIVFFTTGLWHGASWNFIFWGLFHGFFILIERIKLKELLDKNKFKIVNYLYSTFVVLIGWVFFRANGLKQAFQYLETMFTNNSVCKLELSSVINNELIIVLIIAILISGPLQSIYKKIKIKKENSILEFIEIIGLGLLMIICIMKLISNTYNPFIYFRF